MSFPAILTTEAVESSEVVITVGCGDAGPVFPGLGNPNGTLPDTAGKDIEARVLPLTEQLSPTSPAYIKEIVR